jgi:hypothetical protein
MLAISESIVETNRLLAAAILSDMADSIRPSVEEGVDRTNGRDFVTNADAFPTRNNNRQTVNVRNMMKMMDYRLERKGRQSVQTKSTVQR